jgi:3D (Asp-Asp-Asp) domain-containing protein
MKKLSMLFALSCLPFAALAQGQQGPQGSQDPSRDPATLKLRNTHYYVVLEKLYAEEPKDAALLDMKGQVLAQVSKRFKAHSDIEGTARLIDGRVLNYAGVINKEIRWLVTQAPFGLGVRNCELEPFRTVAIDPKVVPLGTLIKIHETVGMKLPDGQVHDGYWHAYDVGGAIKKDRIDLFVGDGDRGDVLRAHKIRSLQALTIEIVSPPPPDSCVHPKRAI